MGSLGSGSSVVVIFDFDKTIIDCDSDNWVVDGLGATEMFEGLLQTMPWNTAINKVMCGLHSQGTSVTEVADCLRKAPLDQNVIAAIKAAFALGCDLRIVSDANMFFITTILEHHGLLEYFSEINTNPGHIDGDGRLRIAAFHDFHRDGPGCPLASCPPNMCKGRIIERIQSEVGPETRFVYLGDGKGDFCPSLKLSAKDFVMPRKDYPLWELIQNRSGGSDKELVVKAQVHEWRSWVEQFEALVVLVQRATSSAHTDPPASVGASSVDCSTYTAPAVLPLAGSYSHETLPKPLSVHH